MFLLRIMLGLVYISDAAVAAPDRPQASDLQVCLRADSKLAQPAADQSCLGPKHVSYSQTIWTVGLCLSSIYFILYRC